MSSLFLSRPRFPDPFHLLLDIFEHMSVKGDRQLAIRTRQSSPFHHFREGIFCVSSTYGTRKRKLLLHVGISEISTQVLLREDAFACSASLCPYCFSQRVLSCLTSLLYPTFAFMRPSFWTEVRALVWRLLTTRCPGWAFRSKRTFLPSCGFRQPCTQSAG